MTTTVSDIIERFPELLRLEHGDPSIGVSQPCAPNAPSSGCILFLNDPRLISGATQSPAAALVVGEKDIDDPALSDAPQTVLSTGNPELALARVARELFAVTVNKEPFEEQRIHASAVVARSATIAKDAVVGPNAVIGDGARIGSACVIGANTTIEADAVIGDGSHIHANVFIGHGTRIGARCEVHPTSALGAEGFGYAHDDAFNHYRHMHYGRLILEDDVHVGAGVTIDRGHFRDSIIGSGTKIDNHCHIAHNVQVGKNCLMVADFIAAGTATIGDNNVFGGRTGVTDHVTVGSNMQFSALSSIFKDVDQPGKAFGGHPLQPIKDYLKASASVAQLPELRRNVARIMRKLGMN